MDCWQHYENSIPAGIPTASFLSCTNMPLYVVRSHSFSMNLVRCTQWQQPCGYSVACCTGVHADATVKIGQKSLKSHGHGSVKFGSAATVDGTADGDGAEDHEAEADEESRPRHGKVSRGLISVWIHCSCGQSGCGKILPEPCGPKHGQLYTTFAATTSYLRNFHT